MTMLCSAQWAKRIGTVQSEAFRLQARQVHVQLEYCSKESTDFSDLDLASSERELDENDIEPVSQPGGPSGACPCPGARAERTEAAASAAR